ncbi:MAG: porin family protein [Hyphomicrobiales bacterium]
MQPKTIRLAHHVTFAAFALAISTPGMAADLNYGGKSYLGSKPAMSRDHWTGAYAGVSLGSMGAATGVERGAGNSDFESDDGSFMFGGFVGYNFRPFSGGWLIGTELDVAVGDIELNKTDAILGNTETTGNFISSLQIRAGYAWQRVFIYGTAGLAVTDIDLSPQGNGDDDIRAGIALGVGAEFAINEKWSTRLDATGYGFGKDDENFNGTNRDVVIGAGTLRAGILRRF